MSNSRFGKKSLAAGLLLCSTQLFAQAPQQSVAVSSFDPAHAISGENYALPWPGIKESNIMWKKRVWREIDTREPANAVMGYNAQAPASSNLAGIIMGGLVSGAITAFDAADDRFTTRLSKDQAISKMLTPGAAEGKNAKATFNPATIVKYKIKEDWLFLEKEQKMVVRMVGIAPVALTTGSDGTLHEETLLWLYDAEIRTFLAQHNVYDPSGKVNKNWDEFLESRGFSSKITNVANTKVPFPTLQATSDNTQKAK
jgi:gliding motility associated protien GldN